MKAFINLLILIIVAVFFTRCSIYYESPKKLNKKYAELAPYDIIIVPGFPHEEENYSKIIQMRLLWAQKLFEEGKTKNIMYSGSAVHSPYIESKVMQKTAIAMGVPAKNTFTEEDALHSTENLYYSYIKAQEMGFKKIALATDPFQNFSLNNFRIKYGIDVGMLPIVYPELEGMDTELPNVDVSEFYIENFIPLNEIENFAERFQGTLGNKIMWREQDLINKTQIKRKRKKGLIRSEKGLTQQKNNSMNN
ncbi:MAG: YdcF family protein [Chitinophagales bacterium]